MFHALLCPYAWELLQTLENSQELFKFVFIHHLVGGCGEASRGGIECVKYYEWGGTSSDDTYGFQTHRPNWSLPIHEILVQNNVSIVFHGHDHVLSLKDAIYIIKKITRIKNDTRKIFPGNIILGRPTDQSVTVNYLSAKNERFYASEAEFLVGNRIHFEFSLFLTLQNN